MMSTLLVVSCRDGERRIPCYVAGTVPDGRFELVFTTAMSAYVESCTDPSYRAQALAFSHPVVGAHGLPSHAEQSQAVQPAIVIAAAPTTEFTSWIVRRGGCIVTCHDTRTVVALARCGAEVWIDGHGGDLMTPRLANNAMVASHAECTIVDLGCKSAIATGMLRRGVSVAIVSAVNLRAAIAAGTRGIILSNGPGDPWHDMCGARVAAEAIASGVPTLGICYGHQLLAIADGLRIKRLRCGHRGTNHPIANVRTGNVTVTSHNHGFTVAEPGAGEALVTYRSALDGTVEGIERDSFSGVQFHPEGSPGPRLDEVMDSFAMAITGARRCT